MATNMYGEKIPEKPKQTDIELQPDDVFEEVDLQPDYRLDIDMNEPNLTLMSLIQRTKVALDQLDSEKVLGIYLVSGFKELHVYDFWEDYFKYLKTVENRKILYFRGYLHFQNLGFFYSNFQEIYLLRNSKLIYDCKKLHEILNVFSNDLRHFQNFSQRFLGYYKNLHYFITEDFTELETIGLPFKIM